MRSPPFLLFFKAQQNLPPRQRQPRVTGTLQDLPENAVSRQERVAASHSARQGSSRGGPCHEGRHLLLGLRCLHQILIGFRSASDPPAIPLPAPAVPGGHAGNLDDIICAWNHGNRSVSGVRMASFLSRAVAIDVFAMSHGVCHPYATLNPLGSSERIVNAVAMLQNCAFTT